MIVPGVPIKKELVTAPLLNKSLIILAIINDVFQLNHFGVVVNLINGP